MERSAEKEAVVLAVLNEHYDYSQYVNAEKSSEYVTVWEARCACGETLTDTSNGPSFDQRLRAHQAALVARTYPPASSSPEEGQ